MSELPPTRAVKGASAAGPATGLYAAPQLPALSELPRDSSVRGEQEAVKRDDSVPVKCENEGVDEEDKAKFDSATGNDTDDESAPPSKKAKLTPESVPEPEPEPIPAEEELAPIIAIGIGGSIPAGFGPACLAVCAWLRLFQQFNGAYKEKVEMRHFDLLIRVLEFRFQLGQRGDCAETMAWDEAKKLWEEVMEISPHARHPSIAT